MNGQPLGKKRSGKHGGKRTSETSDTKGPTTDIPYRFRARLRAHPCALCALHNDAAIAGCGGYGHHGTHVRLLLHCRRGSGSGDLQHHLLASGLLARGLHWLQRPGRHERLSDGALQGPACAGMHGTCALPCASCTSGPHIRGRHAHHDPGCGHKGCCLDLLQHPHLGCAPGSWQLCAAWLAHGAFQDTRKPCHADGQQFSQHHTCPALRACAGMGRQGRSPSHPHCPGLCPSCGPLGSLEGFAAPAQGEGGKNGSFAGGHEFQGHAFHGKGERKPSLAHSVHAGPDQHLHGDCVHLRDNNAFGKRSPCPDSACLHLCLRGYCQCLERLRRKGAGWQKPCPHEGRLQDDTWLDGCLWPCHDRHLPFVAHAHAFPVHGS